MANNKNKNKDGIIKAEDVEYSRDLADQDDLEAQERAKAADQRAQKGK